jgi:hypothetical protein
MCFSNSRTARTYSQDIPMLNTARYSDAQRGQAFHDYPLQNLVTKGSPNVANRIFGHAFHSGEDCAKLTAKSIEFAKAAEFPKFE